MDTYEARDKEIDEMNATKEMGFNCLEILPEEMWRGLMETLGKDVNALLNCRGVCPELKIVAEEELASQMAKVFLYRCYFMHESGVPPSFEEYYRQQNSGLAICIKAARFTKPNDAQNVIASKDIVKVGNHFPNGCVKFYPEGSLDDLLPFYNSLESLVNNFTEDITSLVYAADHILDSAQFLTQLFLISKLENLRQLLIYCSRELLFDRKFKLDMMNKLVQKTGMKFPDMNRLRNLQLLEFPCHKKNTLPLMTVLKNFLPSWKVLQCLSFAWNSNIDMREILEQMMEHPPPPKLLSLELQDPSIQLLEYFCRDHEEKDGVLYPRKLPRLKALTIQFSEGVNEIESPVSGYSKEESRVILLFKTLDVNQTDLEVLQLGFYIPPEFQPHQEPLPLDLTVKFTKLKYLYFNYTTLLRWGSLFEVLKEKLPNVESITLENSYHCSVILNEGNKKLVQTYFLALKLWEVFPLLKKIYIRFYDLTLKRGGKIPEKVTQAAAALG